jgi:hypothetical protein
VADGVSCTTDEKIEVTHNPTNAATDPAYKDRSGFPPFCGRNHFEGTGYRVDAGAG